MKLIRSLASVAIFSLVAACGERPAEPDQQAPATEAPSAAAESAMVGTEADGDMMLSGTTSSSSLMNRMEKVRLLDPARYAPPSTPQAHSGLLARAAELLVRAREPLIIAGNCGRNAAAVASLVDLAEALGARVITSDVMMNFPTTHPLCHYKEVVSV